MKDKILDVLKTKFVGIKDDILDRIATKASKTINTEDEITTYVEGVTLQSIIDAEGDRRATDAQKTAVANYERKHNIKDGKAIEQQPKPSEVNPPVVEKQNEDMPAWAKAIMQMAEATNKRLDAFDAEKTTKSRRSQLDEILKDSPEKIRSRYVKDFERFSFKDDEDFATWLGETKTDIEGINNDFASRKGIVTPPKAGGKAEGNVSADVQARIDAQAKEAQGQSSAIRG